MSAFTSNPAPGTDDRTGQEGQTGGTLEAQAPQQQPTGQDSEGFTGVDLSTIDRETLTPEMQQVYDKLSDMQTSMNKHFTQTMQGVRGREAELNDLTRDAEAWRAIMEHPEARAYITQLASGATPEPAGRGAEEEPGGFGDIDPALLESNPWEAMSILVATVVDEALDRRLTPVEQSMQQVTGFVNTNQANLEFENLAAKYPALRAEGMRERLGIIRSQYRDTQGRPISMEKALGMLAVANPNILVQSPQSQTTGGAPGGRQTTTTGQKPNTGVEKPASTGAGGTAPALPSGVKGIQAKLKQLWESGEALSPEAVANKLREQWRGTRLG